jgi:hypothetical protein
LILNQAMRLWSSASASEVVVVVAEDVLALEDVLVLEDELVLEDDLVVEGAVWRAKFATGFGRLLVRTKGVLGGFADPVPISPWLARQGDEPFMDEHTPDSGE